MKKEELIRTIKFVLLSASAGIIQAGSFALFNEVLKLPGYWTCYLPSLLLSIIWNFTLNRKFTFKSANNVPKAMIQVLLFYCVFTPVTTILGNMLADSVNEYIILAVTMILNLTLEYIYDRFYVFKDSIDSAK